MERGNIDKIAQSPEDRLLLAKLWDKIHAGIVRNIPANTPFLSPREQVLAQYLFGDSPELFWFGGYESAERKMLVYLPEYLSEEYLYDDQTPLCCLRASFYENIELTHRDFLGALMGAGIARETVGDICVDKGGCDFLVTAEIAPYILQNLDQAGRAKLQIRQIPLSQMQIPEASFQVLKDTVASVRLDAVIATGFRMGRTQAAQAISAGKVSIDGLICEKPDKIIPEGAKISLRGLGKIQLAQIGKQTKKGRISVVIHRYQ